MESSCNYSTMHPSSNRESSLQNATADIRLKMLSHVFEKKSRAAVWRLEEPCECIREIQCTHSVIHRDIQTPTHFETFLLAGWCLSCRFPYSVSVSWGKKKQRHFRYDSNTERGPSTSLVYVAVFFSVSRSKFIFHKHLSDNIFCWHWTGLLQSKVQRPTDLHISIFFSWNLLLSSLYQSIVEPQDKFFLLFCCCCSPSRRNLWPWWSVCTQTQTGRWTCTGPLSAPCQSAALAPSGCISRCQCHSPDLEVRQESIGWRRLWVKGK